MLLLTTLSSLKTCKHGINENLMSLICFQYVRHFPYLLFSTYICLFLSNGEEAIRRSSLAIKTYNAYC